MKKHLKNEKLKKIRIEKIIRVGNPRPKLNIFNFAFEFLIRPYYVMIFNVNYASSFSLITVHLKIFIEK